MRPFLVLIEVETEVENTLNQGFSSFFLPFTPCQLPNIKLTPAFCLLTSAAGKSSVVTSASLNLPPG